MLTNVLLQVLRYGKISPWKITAVIGMTSLLAACGGGGGGGGEKSATAATTTPSTPTAIQAGDYFVYSETITQTLPTPTPAQTSNFTNSYVSMGADGSSQQKSTSEGPTFQNTLNASGAAVSKSQIINGTSVTCPYEPALQADPPFPRSVGQTWNSSSTSTCNSDTSNHTVSGKVLAREQLVTPMGSFDSYKVSKSYQLVINIHIGADTINVTNVSQSTCWYEVQRGEMLRCEGTNSSPSANSPTPASAATFVTTLTGFGGPHQTPQGDVLPRFAGSWHVQYTGNVSGDCAQLTVTTSGGISGSCTMAATGASFNVTGSVNSSGQVAIALPTGGSLTGTLSTPYEGAGTWVDGSYTGTWTASRNDGGWGSNSGSATTLPTTTITLPQAQVGDYLVYSATQTQNLQTGTQTSTSSQTNSYLSIAADGTHQLATTTDSAPASQTTLNANDGSVDKTEAINGTSVNCPYLPALQEVPPYPRSVGQTWNSTSDRTCGNATSTVTVSGQILAREPLVTPAGTFDSYRVSRTSQTVMNILYVPTITLTGQSTCWYEVQRGVPLQCDSTYTTSMSSSTSTSSNTMILSGFGGPNRTPLGNVLPRFAGSWNVQYTGGNSGSCAQLTVTASGSISGSCTATTGANFNVTGSVNSSGQVAIALPTGGSLTGTLTAPYEGAGTWIDGSYTGTWTASHN